MRRRIRPGLLPSVSPSPRAAEAGGFVRRGGGEQPKSRSLPPSGRRAPDQRSSVRSQAISAETSSAGKAISGMSGCPVAMPSASDSARCSTG